jgi:hypothetical protein
MLELIKLLNEFHAAYEAFCANAIDSSNTHSENNNIIKSLDESLSVLKTKLENSDYQKLLSVKEEINQVEKTYTREMDAKSKEIEEELKKEGKDIDKKRKDLAREHNELTKNSQEKQKAIIDLDKNNEKLYLDSVTFFFDKHEALMNSLKGIHEKCASQLNIKYDGLVNLVSEQSTGLDFQMQVLELLSSIQAEIIEKKEVLSQQSKAEHESEFNKMMDILNSILGEIKKQKEQFKQFKEDEIVGVDIRSIQKRMFDLSQKVESESKNKFSLANEALFGPDSRLNKLKLATKTLKTKYVDSIAAAKVVDEPLKSNNLKSNNIGSETQANVSSPFTPTSLATSTSTSTSTSTFTPTSAQTPLYSSISTYSASVPPSTSTSISTPPSTPEVLTKKKKTRKNAKDRDNARVMMASKKETKKKEISAQDLLKQEITAELKKAKLKIDALYTIDEGHQLYELVESVKLRINAVKQSEGEESSSLSDVLENITGFAENITNLFSGNEVENEKEVVHHSVQSLSENKLPGNKKEINALTSIDKIDKLKTELNDLTSFRKDLNAVSENIEANQAIVAAEKEKIKASFNENSSVAVNNGLRNKLVRDLLDQIDAYASEKHSEYLKSLSFNLDDEKSTITDKIRAKRRAVKDEVDVHLSQLKTGIKAANALPERDFDNNTQQGNLSWKLKNLEVLVKKLKLNELNEDLLVQLLKAENAFNKIASEVGFGNDLAGQRKKYQSLFNHYEKLTFLGKNSWSKKSLDNANKLVTDILTELQAEIDKIEVSSLSVDNSSQIKSPFKDVADEKIQSYLDKLTKPLDDFEKRKKLEYKKELQDKLTNAKEIQAQIEIALEAYNVSTQAFNRVDDKKMILESKITAIDSKIALNKTSNALLVKDKVNTDLLLNYNKSKKKFKNRELVLVDADPIVATLNDLPIKSNIAYVCTNAKLFYVNKVNNEITEIKLSLLPGSHIERMNRNKQSMERFLKLMQPSKKSRILSKDELSTIQQFTGNRRDDAKAMFKKNTDKATTSHLKARKRVNAILNNNVININKHKNTLEDVKGEYFEGIRKKLTDSKAFSDFKEHVARHVRENSEKSALLQAYVNKFDSTNSVNPFDQSDNLYDLIALVKYMPVKGFEQADYNKLTKPSGVGDSIGQYFGFESNTKKLIAALNQELNAIIRGEFLYHTVYNEVNNKVNEKCLFVRQEDEAHYNDRIRDIDSDPSLAQADKVKLKTELAAINNSACTAEHKNARMDAAMELVYNNGQGLFYDKTTETERFDYLYEQLRLNVSKVKNGNPQHEQAIQELWRVLESVDQDEAWSDFEKIKRMVSIVDKTRYEVKKSDSASWFSFFASETPLARCLDNFILDLNSQVKELKQLDQLNRQKQNAKQESEKAQIEEAGIEVINLAKEHMHKKFMPKQEASTTSISTTTTTSTTTTMPTTRGSNRK